MTLREAATWQVLYERRRKRHLANLMMVMAVASQGDKKSMDAMLKDLMP